MILWTIQHRVAYKEMLQTGLLRAKSSYICEEFVRDAYEWMAGQMKNRIGNSLEDDVVHSAEERKKSWEKIFDYECTFDEERSTELSTQATMWEIKAEWVKKVEYFVVR